MEGRDIMRDLDTMASTILESSPFPFVALDKEQCFIYINRKAEEMLRKSRSDLLGKNFRDEFPAEVLAPFHAAYQNASRTGTAGTPTHFEVLYAPLDTWLEVHVYPSEAGISVYFHELGDRKQAAETLQSSEQRLRAIWQTSADAMALSDPHGTVLDVNPAYLELYGYTYDEVVGHNFAIIFPAQHRAAANKEYIETFNREGPPVPAFERVIQRKDGTSRVVDARVEFIEEKGRRVAMLSSIRDITERVRQAEALRESEERFRQTFDGAPIGLALVGLDFKPFRVNNALCKFLGYSAQELTGLTAIDITYPDDIAADMELGVQLYSGEIPSYTLEKRYITRSGDIVWAQLSATVIRDVSGNILYALAMLEDITGRKRAEEEHSMLLASEHEARTLAERAVRTQEEVLAMVSHDLRNPITVIQGVTQLIQRRIARGIPLKLDQLNSDLTRLSEAAEKMDKFIEDLSAPQNLTPGQPLSLTPVSVDLVTLARHVAESHQLQTEKHRLVVDAETPQLIGQWDPARLEQVLDNLVTNAVKYSPQGGVVKISVGYENNPTEDVRGNQQAEGNNNYAVVTVRDEGMGIPSHELTHVFEWYRRGSNVRDLVQGTGVGLAGAHQIITQHGGRITVESEEGVGSTFTVRLPLTSCN